MDQKSSFKLMKNRNQKLILRLIKQSQQISRADLAKKSGLSPATVTNIVKDLIDNLLIKESKLGKSRGGRKPVFLRLNGEDIKVIGIYWGINFIKYALVNLEGKIEKTNTFKVDESTLSNYLKKTKMITEDLFKLYDKKMLKGLGIGIHGIVDPNKGISKYAPHFDWNNKNIMKKLNKMYNIPLKIDNDVRMMARAERWEKNSDFIFINTGSGIGSAIILNNKLIYGKDYLAGEIGHTIIKEDGPLCSCGNRGCLEAFVSREKILEYFREQFGEDLDSWKRLCTIINEEKQPTKNILKYISKYYGIALVNIINLLNPDQIIFGGDLIDIKDRLYPYLIQFVTENSLNKSQNVADIKFTKFNKNTGAVGAGIAILERYFYDEGDL